MKKAVITAFLLFAGAFLLLFSFQKDKKRNTDSGKKIYATNTVTAVKPENRTSSVKTQEQVQLEEALPQAPAVQPTEPEMNEALTGLFNEMPRTSLLKQASAHEFHGTPGPVLAAGEKLAEIHEYFFNHPQPRDVEMSFYLKCSQQKDFFDSVRAICAARLSQHYFEATGHQISSELFDKNIDQLRREINL